MKAAGDAIAYFQAMVGSRVEDEIMTHLSDLSVASVALYNGEQQFVMSATMGHYAPATRAACVSDVSVKFVFGTNDLKDFS